MSTQEGRDSKSLCDGHIDYIVNLLQRRFFKDSGFLSHFSWKM